MRASFTLMGGFVPAAAVSLATLLCSPALADGLFYRLPADGASARFEMEMKDDSRDRMMSGTMTMSSVGRVEHNGEPARWIEFKMTMKDPSGRDESVVAKALILEKHLKRGERPFDNFIKCYQRHGEGEVREVKDVNSNDAGPLPAFLSGPLDEAKELPEAETDSALGKLACGGVTGKLVVPQGDNTVTVMFENRLNDRAPFGVVTSTMKFEVVRNGETGEKGTITLKLVEVGMGATSALPDVK
jgi:hypothetical protein